MQIKLLSLALILGLSSCATLDKSECLAAEWQTIGFEDGAEGRSLTYLGNHREACAEHGVKPDLDLYRTGHEDGLEVFCTADNGFKQGRKGRSRSDVCPAHLRGLFLAAYDTGKKLYDLEDAIEDQLRDADRLKDDRVLLEKRVKNLEAVLVSGALSAAERKLVLEDFKNMQSRLLKINIDIRDMELNAARMQGQLDTLEASHRY